MSGLGLVFLLVLGAQVCVSSWGLKLCVGLGVARRSGAWGCGSAWWLGLRSVCWAGDQDQALCMWLLLGAVCGARGGADTCEGSSRRPRVGSDSHTSVLGLLQGSVWGFTDPGLGAPGALRLNQAALAHASGCHLRLLPQQRYLQVERAEVSALQRKRNILCCLITCILKVEKQLHIDNLVFRVWRA